MTVKLNEPPAAFGWPPPPNSRAMRWLMGGTDRIENLPSFPMITSISVFFWSRMKWAVSLGYP